MEESATFWLTSAIPGAHDHRRRVVLGWYRLCPFSRDVAERCSPAPREPDLGQLPFEEIDLGVPRVTEEGEVMDGMRFDALVRQLSNGQVGRRQLIGRSISIGLGTAITGRAVFAQDDPTPEGDTFPAGTCPEPDDPGNWLCVPGPFDPWYPVMAPRDLTAETGIFWFGIDVQEGSALTAVAFTQGGQEVSRYEGRGDGNGMSWILSDATTRLEGAMSVESDGEDGVRIAGDFNEIPFTATIDAAGLTDADLAQDPDIDPTQQRLLDQWQPVVRNLNGLFEIALVSDDGPIPEGNSACFAAGFVAGFTWAGCFLGPAGCLPAAAAASYIANNCTSEW